MQIFTRNKTARKGSEKGQEVIWNKSKNSWTSWAGQRKRSTQASDTYGKRPAGGWPKPKRSREQKDAQLERDRKKRHAKRELARNPSGLMGSAAPPPPKPRSGFGFGLGRG